MVTSNLLYFFLIYFIILTGYVAWNWLRYLLSVIRGIGDTSFCENFSWNFSYSMMIPETLGNINLLMLRILNYIFLEMGKHWNFLSVWCNSMILIRGYLQLMNIFWMFILNVTLGYTDFYVSWIHIFCNVELLK